MKDKKIEVASPDGGEKKVSVVAQGAEMVGSHTRVARFRGRPMVEILEPFPHFVPLHREMFDKIAYPLLGGVSRSRMGDIFSFLGNTAEDLTPQENLVLFGVPGGHEDFDDEMTRLHVWDMTALRFVDVRYGDGAIWRSPYGAVPSPAPAEPAVAPDPRVPFIMSLAGGDPLLYDDIMQSLAPLVMDKKPDGVIWWVGAGANGKSTLMDAIYRIFPGQLSSITVKRLTDGRDTPSLNGTLANVVKESSEGRVDDTEIYKAVGTHENFRVHKFHSQDDMEIRGNIHHIFSGNSVPTFNDKGYSARRRTFIIPFGQVFQSDPTFEENTFTAEMFGQLIAEMCRYAVRLRTQGYRYKWSATTLAAKAEYDTDANNAEEYARHIVGEGVVGFESFAPVKMDYENWCADNGYVPLGITNLRRAVSALSFERMTFRDGADNVHKHYQLPGFKRNEMRDFNLGRPGLFTMPGFERPPAEDVMAAEKPKPKPKPVQESILKLGRW